MAQGRIASRLIGLIPGLVLLAAVTAPLVGTQVAAHPASVFRDCPGCPEMVTIPPGSYVMGSTQEERTALGVPPLFDTMESPRHRVTIGRAFAIGRFAVTFAEWDACVADGGCGGYRPDDNGWGRGRRPVINVNWRDAQAYVTWLGRKTGRDYRLPSEGEWEYAARAGATGVYPFGQVVSDADANFGGHRGRTMEVGSYPPNAFGLYDVTGNTAEWLQDCHHDSYDGAPTDGAPWLTGACILRNVRGGGWSLESWSVRVAQRIGDPPGSRNNHLGFRIAETLPVSARP